MKSPIQPIRRVLVSVSDTTHLADLAGPLVRELGLPVKATRAAAEILQYHYLMHAPIDDLAFDFVPGDLIILDRSVERNILLRAALQSDAIIPVSSWVAYPHIVAELRLHDAALSLAYSRRCIEETLRIAG